MATIVESMPDRSFSVGRVFERTFSTIRTNPVPIILIAAVLGGLPSVGITYFLEELRLFRSDNFSFSVASIIAGFVLYVALVLIIGAITQATLTRATVADAEGRKASIGECVAAGIAIILPLIGLSFMFALGVGLGFVLLIIPGIILYVTWSVSVPALVEERQGVFGSLERSRDLTRGARWKVFGILLVVTVIFWLFSVVGELAVNGVAGPTDPEALFNATPSAIALALLTSTAYTLFYGLVQASLYVELRDWKDGPGNASLEQVFS